MSSKGSTIKAPKPKLAPIPAVNVKAPAATAVVAAAELHMEKARKLMAAAIAALVIASKHFK
ncbi:hypothetical protein GCM10007966_12430 [Legionella impletisoli]|uniref:Uncharacterized protein n=1 Tax=Legionella impletisoli TaxID=343510 RepID=A0A917JWK9_9GAMM|nr:hypothetical protein GCM10007966_12430 [Legionella impletisoli]